MDLGHTPGGSSCLDIPACLLANRPYLSLLPVFAHFQPFPPPKTICLPCPPLGLDRSSVYTTRMAAVSWTRSSSSPPWSVPGSTRSRPKTSSTKSTQMAGTASGSRSLKSGEGACFGSRGFSPRCLCYYLVASLPGSGVWLCGLGPGHLGLHCRSRRLAGWPHSPFVPMCVLPFAPPPPCCCPPSAC